MRARPPPPSKPQPSCKLASAGPRTKHVNRTFKPARLGNAGDSNDDVTETASLASVWKQKSGVAVDYLVQDGASHSEVYWRQRIPGALAFLLGPR